MTQDRIRELLEAYGADSSRWPAEDRKLAAFLTTDAELQRNSAAARRLDALMNRAAPAMPGRARHRHAATARLCRDCGRR
jgi:hypothetical protein